MIKSNPLGIKVFGIGNVLIGTLFFIMFFVYFYLAVSELWIGDREPYSLVEWFFSSIIGRLAVITVFVFSFQLIRSGIALFIGDRRSRKMSIVANLVLTIALLVLLLSSILLKIIYPQYIQLSFSFLDFIIGGFVIYATLLTIYFNDACISKLFDDQNIKLSFIRPILIIALSFLFPFVFFYFF